MCTGIRTKTVNFEVSQHGALEVRERMCCENVYLHGVHYTDSVQISQWTKQQQPHLQMQSVNGQGNGVKKALS
jgi:hypothetical protein